MSIDSLNFLGNIPNNNQFAVLPATVAQSRLDGTTPAAEAVQAIPTFSDFLSRSLGETVSTDAAAKSAGIDLVLGGDQELHNIIIAAQQAEITLNLAVQIRNRMVEAYQEIMRMQV